MGRQNMPPNLQSRMTKQNSNTHTVSDDSPFEIMKKNIPEIIYVILIGILFNVDIFNKLFIFKNTPMFYDIQNETITYTMIAFKALIMGTLFYFTKLLT